jgi:hypothetical protein
MYLIATVYIIQVFIVFRATKPFDRHDWTVDRCGQPVRYVLDFYTGKSKENSLVSMHIDVRPALDSPQAAWDRLIVAGEEIWRDTQAWVKSLWEPS